MLKIALGYYIKRVLYVLLHFFWILPVKKNQIYFESFLGKNITCNPLYIFEYLNKFCNGYKYVWCFNGMPPKEMADYGIEFVRYHSLKWLKVYMCSRVIISNVGVSTFIPFRKSQVLINTWHGGGAYKKVAIKDNQELNNSYEKKLYVVLKKHNNNYKCISSSRAFTNCMYDSLCIDKKDFLEIGMPRNDVFFDKLKMVCYKNKVFDLLGLDKDDFFVLYAPTYRGSTSNPEFSISQTINPGLVSNSIYKRFKKKVKFAYRMHYSVSSGIVTDKAVVDVSDYPNMQELLCAADMLITDYSSSMWDYSFTGKPCILFAPDIEVYLESRGFYTDPYSWGFPIVKTNEELCNVIECFDLDKFKENMEIHHNILGSFENGTSTKQFYEILMQLLNNNRDGKRRNKKINYDKNIS